MTRTTDSYTEGMMIQRERILSKRSALKRARAYDRMAARAHGNGDHEMGNHWAHRAKVCRSRARRCLA